ncbi:uncharacterized protein LOC107614651 isoform X1 [Arachis ipaensis]|nr:uncharacterized protein LOC107614651 isoform X1 [Arachis ipaensis]XP_020966152.1 uncharacterized protein LOC107614651 isoform X1 [Arachis ipaensis]XP_020966153.1 uncharacterized protein LOC107614651 isoform X1 [Arachis ipaensis]XP_029151365.1 uncharacterized protein LOC112775984 isoform X1 [Arachis hypogaea]XP_029151366.1 uncharacterized protein LOC112775984 isoform X1 [Arachis hypogaea]XP_029151367.1 uncharacterized protein LOC112775984 isoform X1 [Arachis hypogaea]
MNAAKVALSFLKEQKGMTHSYKKLLQELVQKEGCSLPSYITKSSSNDHNSTFVVRVKVKGEVFPGEEAKTKKQAEINAAKVAVTILNEQKDLLKTAKRAELDKLAAFSPASLAGLEQLLNDTYVNQIQEPIDYHKRVDLVHKFNMISRKIYGNYLFITSFFDNLFGYFIGVAQHDCISTFPHEWM